MASSPPCSSTLGSDSSIDITMFDNDPDQIEGTLSLRCSTEHLCTLRQTESARADDYRRSDPEPPRKEGPEDWVIDVHPLKNDQSSRDPSPLQTPSNQFPYLKRKHGVSKMAESRPNFLGSQSSPLLNPRFPTDHTFQPDQSSLESSNASLRELYFRQRNYATGCQTKVSSPQRPLSARYQDSLKQASTHQQSNYETYEVNPRPLSPALTFPIPSTQPERRLILTPQTQTDSHPPIPGSTRRHPQRHLLMPLRYRPDSNRENNQIWLQVSSKLKASRSFHISRGHPPLDFQPLLPSINSLPIFILSMKRICHNSLSSQCLTGSANHPGSPFPSSQKVG